MEEGSGYPKWDELGADALGLIFKELELFELLTVIPCVCKSWLEVAMGPYCWQEINISNWCYGKFDNDEEIYRMLQLLLPRSGGSLRELSVSFGTDDCLLLIAKHAQCLQTLNLENCCIEDVTFERAAPMLSAITSLDLSDGFKFGPQAAQAIGKHCNSLTSLKLNWNVNGLDHNDEKAQAIASSMPHLKNLEIIGFIISMSALVKILESCKHLEQLDISWCQIVGWDAEVLKRYPKVKFEGLDWMYLLRDL